MTKKIYVLLVFALSTLSTLSTKAQLTNQRLFDTIPFIVDHYARRIAKFESEQVPPNSVVFLGNSITEGGRWKKLTGDSSAINRGIGGDITFGVLKRLNEIISAKPSKLFLLIGINDIGKDIPGAVIADNIRKIIQRFQKESPTTKLYVQTIFPVNPEIKGFPQHYDKNEHVRKANEHIRTVVTLLKVRLIDTYKLFSDKRGLLRQEFTDDGLHINAQGYEHWANHLKTAGAL